MGPLPIGLPKWFLFVVYIFRIPQGNPKDTYGPLTPKSTKTRHVLETRNPYPKGPCAQIVYSLALK